MRKRALLFRFGAEKFGRWARWPACPLFFCTCGAPEERTEKGGLLVTREEIRGKETLRRVEEK